MFFNTKASIINVSKKVETFLRYLENQEVNDDYTKRLADEVFAARFNREWMVEYMKTLVHDMDIRDEARQEGIEIGIERGIGIGREEGIGIGREEMVISMFNSGIPIEQIASIARMSKEEVLHIVSKK